VPHHCVLIYNKLALQNQLNDHSITGMSDVTHDAVLLTAKDIFASVTTSIAPAAVDHAILKESRRSLWGKKEKYCPKMQKQMNK